MKRIQWIFILLILLVVVPTYSLFAEDGKKSPPLPLHGIEGYGGIAITYCAYLTNPGENDSVFGLPSVGGGLLVTPEGRSFMFTTFTETLFSRLELGFGFNQFDLHDLPKDIQAATSVDIEDELVQMYNLNARFAVLKEGDFDQSWLPALTFGYHYKTNDDLDDIDTRLGGALTAAGIEDDSGYDLTLYASKMLTPFPRPVLLNVGARSTEAAHIGLLGFTGDRDLVFEGNVVVFATDRLALGAEYRQKPNAYRSIPGLVEPEDDWWSVVAAYIVNDHFTISGGIFNLGEVLNHYDDGAVALDIKYEF